ncbi:MAG: hypothetical protein DHS20C05_19530 [Hyphococcus sp.]|nr:MAG: hypothetical protein DHS20C05_19530 [Marinicaulis sp.]
MSEKLQTYDEVKKEILAVLEGEGNLVARMATVSNILHHRFDHYYWTGFYIVDPQKPDELVVGPYQGTMGCLRIPFGKGVCGAAAAERETQIVDDVHAFAGHIACDANSASEIVVPVVNKHGDLIAVFDVDSLEKAAFDADDQKGLEAIISGAFS